MVTRGTQRFRVPARLWGYMRDTLAMTDRPQPLPAARERAGGDAVGRLGRLFDAHHERLYHLARRMAPDAEEARDLVQEAFLRAARRPPALPAEDGAAEAWLVQVVVNLCRDQIRRHGVRRRAAATLLSEERPAESGADVRLAARSAVTAALALLPPRRRAVVVLYELEERSVAEIARLLGLARVTVRWHLAAGRRDLAATLLPGDRS